MNTYGVQMFTISQINFSPRKGKRLLLLMLILTCAFGYYNLMTHISSHVSDFIFEILLLRQVKRSYFFMLNALNVSQSTELDAYICNRIFSELITFDVANETYTPEDRWTVAKKKLSILNLQKIRTEIIRKLSDRAAMQYPLEIDVKNLTEQKIKEKINFTTPINNLTTPYVFNPRQLCRNIDPYLLILIKSDVRNHYLRHILRNTWVKEAYRTFQEAKVAFLLGQSFKERWVIWSENKVYGDIIQGNFTDAYRNNTFKTFMAFQWVEKYCSNAKFVFFVDDDMFVNMKITDKYLKTKHVTNETDLFSGMIVNGGSPAREEASRWYITTKDYPFLVYPPYLAGCSMILSQSVIRKVNALFPYVKYNPFDDVLLGIIVNKLGIEIEHNEYLNNVHLNNLPALHRMIANHGFRDEEFLSKVYHGFTKTY